MSVIKKWRGSGWNPDKFARREISNYPYAIALYLSRGFLHTRAESDTVINEICTYHSKRYDIMPRYTWIDRQVLCAIADRYEQPASTRQIKAYVQQATEVRLRDAELIWSVKRLIQGGWIKEIGSDYRLTARTVRMAPGLLQESDSVTTQEKTLNRILR
jgi:hypothetical protein